MDIQSGPPKFISFGIAYIAEKLKSCRYEAEIIDIDAHRHSKEVVSELIRKKNFDIAAIGGLVTVYPYLYWLVPEIKRLKPDSKIILGGGISTSLKERCFEKFDIDYEVIGEGEITIIELLKELRGDKNLSSVKGIAFRNNGKIVFTEPQPLMSSLDDVPMFDDSLFPMEKLLNNSRGVFQIHTQRGCPYACTFCTNNFRGVSRKVRYRPVNDVINEIEFFKKKYDIKLFALAGELIMVNKTWIIDFCKEVLRRKLKINYRVTSGVGTIDEEKLGWLKKSGCTTISFGTESGSEKILKIMQKGVTVEQGRKAILLTKKYIANIDLSMMLNYLGETRETVRESVKFFKEMGILPNIFFAVPFPGTPLYTTAIEKGYIKDEEEYLMNLDKLSIMNLPLNLTDMPDEEASRVMLAARNEIKRYFFWKKVFSLKIYKALLSNLKHSGFKKTVNKAINKVREFWHETGPPH